MTAVALPQTWEDAAAGLLPLVRTRTTPSNALGAPSSPVVRPLGPSLHLALAWEDDRVRVFLHDRHLTRWNVTADQAFSHALAGVEPAIGLSKSDEGLWVVASEDGNASARAALPGFVDAFRGRVAGTPVLAIPHARRLYLCGSDEPEAIARLVVRAAREWREEGDPISPVLYTASRTALSPWFPEDGPPITRASLRAAAAALLRREYERLVDAIDDLAWADVEVGASAVDGVQEVFTFARWTNGDTVHLPIVDVLVVVEPDRGAVLAVPFAVWHAAMGSNALSVAGMPLPIVRTTGGLDAAAIRALRDHALPPERFGG